MRIASEGALILSFSILSAEAFAQQTFSQHLLNGFLYGVLLILAVYNLVLFFYLRDNSYLYYVLYFGTILLGVMALDGFAAQYLWPSWGAFAAGAARFLMILSFTFGLLFTTSFLRTREYAPRLHKLMIGLAITILILLDLQFIWFRQTAVVHAFLMLTSCLIMIAAGFVVWRKGYKPARYFLLGWSLILVGFFIFVLTLVDIFSFSSSSDALLHLGLIVLAFVLSIGLADRINVYRQEKESAQLAVVIQRTRIAQDLHDSVTQSLYSANLFAEAGQETVQAGDTQGASHYFTRIGAVTQQALKEMRLFLYELRPPDVVEVGLVDALQKRLDAVEKRSGMEARLILDGDIHYADEIGDQYYRIAQEALNNVLKHAQADEVTVYLRAKNGIMGLEVADNGRGFDLMESRKSGGMGLKTMQERSQQIGGEFDIQTAPNQGTKVLVQVNQNHE
jgi:signal transduction histidine kinase